MKVCSFVSARMLRCLLNFFSFPIIPDRIRKVFKEQEPSPIGKYTLCIYYNGQYREVVLDDYFPCENNYPTFSKPKNNKIWVMLLEKCYAKCCTTFENMISGNVDEPIYFLTGVPTKRIKNKSFTIEKLWEELSNCDKQNWVMGTQCDNSTAPTLKNSGLVFSHAYTLLSCVEVKTEKGPVKLVRIRNPWGHGEWKLDWSDESPLWTEDVKKQVDYKKAEDGAFYVSIEDFHKYFDTTDVGCIQDLTYKHYPFNKVNISKPIQYVNYFFNLPPNGKGYFMVTQTNSKWGRARIPKYTQTWIEVYLLKEITESGKSKWWIVKTDSQCFDCCFVSFDGVEPGDYRFVITPLSQSCNEVDIFFNCYTTFEPKFSKIEPSNDSSFNFKFLPKVGVPVVPVVNGEFDWGNFKGFGDFGDFGGFGKGNVTVKKIVIKKNLPEKKEEDQKKQS